LAILLPTHFLYLPLKVLIMKANIKYLVIGALAAMVNTAYADMSKTATGAVVGATACGVAGAVAKSNDPVGSTANPALKAGVACAAVGAAVGSRNDRTDAIEDLGDNLNDNRNRNQTTVIRTDKHNAVVDTNAKKSKPVKKAKREVKKQKYTN
jgi:hypothetical protein